MVRRLFMGQAVQQINQATVDPWLKECVNWEKFVYGLRKAVAPDWNHSSKSYRASYLLVYL